MVSDAYCILESIYIYSNTPICLLTLYILHATMKKLHMIGLGVYGLNREFGISQSGHATVTARYFAKRMNILGH